MNIPDSATIINILLTLDGGSMNLVAASPTREQFRIQLKQRMQQAPDAGRLFFNDEMIDVRSADEDKIIQLLKNASIALEYPVGYSPRKKRISGSATPDDGIKEFLTQPPELTCQSWLEEIVAFVESEEYVRIAREGLPPLKWDGEA